MTLMEACIFSLITALLHADGCIGADYDITDCPPSDLDPHAVASVFKAYLRERMCLGLTK